MGPNICIVNPVIYGHRLDGYLTYKANLFYAIP